MLSAADYRDAEANAVAAHPEIAKMHTTHFPRGNWPWNFADKTADLSSLIDIMHEDRFAHFVNEIGGFTAEDLDTFVDAMARIINFQRIMFPASQPAMPFDTMMAQFVASKKIRAMVPGVRTILEIGPGSGYLPLFFGSIERYAQVEVAPSLYLIQSLIDSFTFGAAFCEQAVTQVETNVPIRCLHYPWWKLQDIERYRFEVITANANWNEMTTEARRSHLALCRKVLAKDGFIVSQCLGGNLTGLDWEGARDLIWGDFIAAGFRPVFFVHRGNTTTEGEFAPLIAPLPLGQAVLVAEGHPWWSRAFTEAADFVCLDEHLIRRAFFHTSQGKTRPSLDDLRQRIMNRVIELAAGLHRQIPPPERSMLSRWIRPALGRRFS